MTKKRAVVIGAGLGGLSAAITLAAAGFHVEVFEKNDKPGGKLNIKTLGGYTFDLGPSILTMPHIFRELFERAGRRLEDYVQFEPVTPHWRNFFEDGLTFDFTPDMAAQERELAKLGPDAGRGFFRFLEYSRELCKLTEEGYFRRGLDTFGELVRHYGPIRSLWGFDVFRSLNGGVRRFVREPHLIDALDYFIKYVGSSPDDAPALLNLLPYVQFGYGLWYVRGGMHALARAMERLLTDIGGTLRTGAEVESITTDGRRVTGITVKEVGPIAADVVVSNMEVVPAHERLLKESTAEVRRFDRFTPSCSGFVLHLGIDRTYPQLAHHNFFYSRNSRRHFRTLFREGRLSEDPTIYLVAPCKTDPGQAPAGGEVIKILPHIPHLQSTPFTEDDFTAYRERILVKLERMGLTDLRRHIVVEDRWTPADIQRMYYSHRGSIYGVVSDRFKNLGFKAPKKSDRYENLYFVGGSVNPGGGMPMVTLSGMKAGERIQEDFRRP
jgi:diapolycopene oxygenase